MRRFLSTEFAVGTFALLGLLVIIYMSLEVKDRASMGGGSKTYYAYFDSVSGLVRRVAVEISGIGAGYVETIELIDNRARVTITIKEDVKVYADASLTIRDRGILGDRFVMMNPGTVGQPVLGDGDEIGRTYSYSDFEKLSQSIGDISAQISALIQSDNPQGALGQTIVHLRDMSAKLNNMVGDNQGRIDRILAHMEAFTEDLSDITSGNKEQIHTLLVALEDVAVSLRSALGEEGSMKKATEDFEKAMASVQKITEKVERGEGTIGKLLNDETTVNNLNETIEGLQDTLGLFRKVRLGIRYRGEFLTDAEELQSLIGISLAFSPDKFVMFEAVDAPVGETKVVNTTVTSGGSVVSATETVQTNDNVLFSFLLGKRFWDVTFRFGLMRNEGGVGMDYHLFKDKFLISFEAFNFSRVNDKAHLRAYGTLVLYKHLLLTGGLDDLITDTDQRNAFFGGGIQFTDDDLKALIGAISLGGL